MALSDFLWACPECGEDRGLSPDRTGHRCRACGTRFRRDRGANIRAERPDGSRVVRHPKEWLERLPAPESIVRRRDGDDPVVRSARVAIRRVTGSDAVHGEHGYLNRIEIWGEETPGTLELRPERLLYTPEDSAGGGARAGEWAFDAITAVQASSSNLQVNRRAAPLASFRFLDDSIFLWERLLRAALQDFYTRTGRGQIVEFQPRIATT